MLSWNTEQLRGLSFETAILNFRMAEAMELQNTNEETLLQSDVETFDMKEMEEELRKAQERRKERDKTRKDRREDLVLKEPYAYKLKKEKEERAEEECERRKEEKRRRRREREEEEERERKERHRRYREREDRERKEQEEREKKEQEERRKLFLLQRKQRGNKMSLTNFKIRKLKHSLYAKCHRCGQRGHYRRECQNAPLRRKRGGGANTPTFHFNGMCNV